jgi:hypothetical protein
MQGSKICNEPKKRQNKAFHCMKDADDLSNSIQLNKGKKRFCLYCSRFYIDDP